MQVINRNQLKYFDIFIEILSELHEDWMDDVDKNEFDNEMLALYGKQFDCDIDSGIEKGYSLEFQKEAIRSIIKELIQMEEAQKI